MATSRRPKTGNAPETIGWLKMMEWLRSDAKHSMYALAEAANVRQPSAHKWKWRRARPVGAALDAVCKVTGASREDWETVVQSKRRRRAA